MAATQEEIRRAQAAQQRQQQLVMQATQEQHVAQALRAAQEQQHAIQAGELLRTSTPPTLNRFLLLRASV